MAGFFFKNLLWSNTLQSDYRLRPRQYGRHFADNICKCILLNENIWIPIKMSLKFVPQGPINNIPALVQIVAWRRPGEKPLSGPMVVRLPTHICVTRLQWVNDVKNVTLNTCHESSCGKISHQTINWVNVEFICHMVSLDQNELITFVVALSILCGHLNQRRNRDSYQWHAVTTCIPIDVYIERHIITVDISDYARHHWFEDVR